MKLEDLKEEMPFKWRVQSTNKWGAKCVAYIDARDVQDILDKVCGQENWSVSYSEFKGNLFATIGIKTDEGTTFKSDCGTESNVEKQKGEASDAFKRAGVMWGIGRFLYSKKLVTIKSVMVDGKDFKGNDKYSPTENGKKIWDVTEYCNRVGNKKQPTPTPPKKEKLTDERFTKAIDALYKGQTKEDGITEYDLTDNQTTALKIALKVIKDGF